MTCDRCGRTLEVGMWPFCPHERGSSDPVDVTWPGGKTFENLGHEPVTFYHRSDYVRYLRQHHLEEMVRHQPLAGSDRSPHTTSWSAVSAETLANATALVTRVTRGTAPARPSLVDAWTVTTTMGHGPVRMRRD
jgi:hypothetical protein